MKRVTFLLLVAALVLPAASGAKTPPPKHPKSALQVLIAKNSAKLCKALKGANAMAFTRLYGTNTNRSNAYGKCVSAHARAKHLTKPATFTLHSITLNAKGKVTSPGAVGCEVSSSGCTVGAAGTLTGFLGGTFTSTFTIMWTQATSTGPTTFCAPATGTVTVTLPGLGTLTKAETGKVCQVGAIGSNAPSTFTGTFTISGGTGVFSNATGTGEANSTQAADGSVSGSETFTTLSIHF